MKIYIKEERVLEGNQYLPGWHDVDPETADRLLETFPMVCRLGRMAYGQRKDKPEPEA